MNRQNIQDIKRPPPARKHCQRKMPASTFRKRLPSQFSRLLELCVGMSVVDKDGESTSWWFAAWLNSLSDHYSSSFNNCNYGNAHAIFHFPYMPSVQLLQINQLRSYHLVSITNFCGFEWLTSNSRVRRIKKSIRSSFTDNQNWDDHFLNLLRKMPAPLLEW